MVAARLTSRGKIHHCHFMPRALPRLLSLKIQHHLPSAAGCASAVRGFLPPTHNGGAAGHFPAFINAAVLVHEAKGSYRRAGIPSAVGADGDTDRPPVLFCIP